MFCPTCQTVVRDGPGFCPTWGEALRDVEAIDVIEVVEVTAELMPDTPVETMGGEAPRAGASSTSTALAIRRVPGELSPPLARAGQLALAAWRQPAVRAAVKTGASAVALSLAVRAARQVLVSPRTRRELARGMTRSVMPSLTDLFANEHDAQDGDYEVVETVFYMRRIVRR